MHVLSLESFRGIIVHNPRLVMSTSSHSLVWFDEKKSFRGNWAGVIFFLNGLIDVFLLIGL